MHAACNIGDLGHSSSYRLSRHEVGIMCGVGTERRALLVGAREITGWICGEIGGTGALRIKRGRCRRALVLVDQLINVIRERIYILFRSVSAEVGAKT